MDNNKDDRYFAEKAIENIDVIKRYVGLKTYDEFMEDGKTVDAIMFRLVQLVENLKGISSTFKNENPTVPWGDIMGFRNGIVHEYGKTEYVVVYEVITRDLDLLREVLSSLI